MDGFEGGYSAFLGPTLLARGPLEAVVTAAKERMDQGLSERLAIFDNDSAVALDFDFRGTIEDVLSRLARHPIVGTGPERPLVKRGRGRPKLGVVAKEVTLLPRHWDWLGEQRGGASATIRRLVEEARKKVTPEDRARRAQEATYRFMGDMAGDLPGFEEASRAFFAGDHAAFLGNIVSWPKDIREHVVAMLERQRKLADEV